MRLYEQDIVNAICLNMAQRKQVRPEEVEVELKYDDDYGFSAEVFVQGRSQILVAANMLEAIERYLFTEQGLRIFRDQIQLKLEDEIVADIV
ncbi:YxcD family protein [Paenibacillus hamazuiensis]|uniref:YxcD family protein n=1 Tax=Paenibacillus hamazuiensis TaxID=2936508 RepID=UPI00200ED965|nr:YxcD family protein [Paenibacillus hamazuiensis]